MKDVIASDTKTDAIMAFLDNHANLQIRAHFSLTDEDVPSFTLGLRGMNAITISLEVLYCPSHLSEDGCCEG